MAGQWVVRWADSTVHAQVETRVDGMVVYLAALTAQQWDYAQAAMMVEHLVETTADKLVDP